MKLRKLRSQQVANLGEPEGLPKLKLTNDMITVSGKSEGEKEQVLDGNNTTFWTSQEVTDGNVNSNNAWMKVDLGATYKLDQVDYTPRYFNAQANYWQCTGNIKKLIVEISKDGQTWTPVTGENGLDLSSKITNTCHSSRRRLHSRHRKQDTCVSAEQSLTIIREIK